jgi:hypothetical protein
MNDTSCLFSNSEERFGHIKLDYLYLLRHFLLFNKPGMGKVMYLLLRCQFCLFLWFFCWNLEFFRTLNSGQIQNYTLISTEVNNDLKYYKFPRLEPKTFSMMHTAWRHFLPIYNQSELLHLSFINSEVQIWIHYAFLFTYNPLNPIT